MTDPDFPCRDCGVNTAQINEYYMVCDSVWLEAGMEKDGGFLCIGCLENRLGRKLERPDFGDFLVNDGFFWDQSARLVDRLGISV